MQMHNPPHPGELVREAMSAIPGLDVTRFAEKLGVSRVALSRMLNGRAGISAPMALSLADALGASAEMWLNLQVQHDLWHAREDRREAAAHGRRTKQATGAVSESKTRLVRQIRTGGSRAKKATSKKPARAA